MEAASSDFTSSVNRVDDVTYEVKISIPADRVEKEFKGTIDTLARSVTLKGFRPGKAPKDLVEKAHGDRLKMEVAQRLIDHSLGSTLREQKLDIVGNPDVNIGTFERGAVMEYTAKLSVFPKPEIKNFDNISVKVPKREVTDKEIDEILGRMRDAKATVKKNEFRDSAKMGDVVDVSLSVKSEGEEASRPEPVTVGLGEKRLPEDVENGIVGMTVGESKTIEAKVPQSHTHADGTVHEEEPKAATFTVTLNGVFDKVLPELDDAFAKSLDIGPQTVLELRMKIREELEGEHKRQSESEVQMAVLDKLVSENQFQVPQALIDDEIRSLLVRGGVVQPDKAAQMNVEPFRKELTEIALKRVRGAIIVDRIGEKEGIKAEEADIEKEVAALAERANVSAEEAKKYVMDRSRFVGFIMEITRSKVIAHLVSKAKVEYSALVEAK